MMKARMLRQKRFFDSRVEPGDLFAGPIQQLSISELLQYPLQTSVGRSTVGDWFDVEGESSDDVLCIGDFRWWDGLGKDWSRGYLTLQGDCGDFVGQGMQGGQIDVHGNVGNRLAQAMQGGVMLVRGSAGDRIGSSESGQRRGMKGGEVIVLGNAGERVGQHMRRGTIVVVGDVGDYLAANMIAGTILLFGSVGAEWSVGMRRGTIIAKEPPSTSSTCLLTEPRLFELSFLPLVWNQLAKSLASFPETSDVLEIPRTRWANRQIGDRAVNGQGEWLYLERLSSGH